MIIQKDQKQLLTKRNRQPSCKFSPPLPNRDFDGRNCVFNSFGPLSNAMETAPPTHTTVPNILAILLKLLGLTFSILIMYNSRKYVKTCTKRIYKINHEKDNFLSSINQIFLNYLLLSFFHAKNKKH